ncbi:Ig-like domain-containing protein [Pseudomonas sp. efr-133-TYG-5]|uniref:Ig-like domain-containing protein n=1 Tax=Pseudomonas sp. efr-133-TYG-5 TaxID=3040310 RepID=UPI00255535B7|nr:Ig-like domain-containing protein [Pseudomonas sp. efr-133-TYG-5]
MNPKSSAIRFCTSHPGGTPIEYGGVTTATAVELGAFGADGAPYALFHNGIFKRKDTFNSSGAFVERFPNLAPGPHQFELREDENGPTISDWRLTVQAMLNPPQIDEAEANNSVLDVAALGSRDANLRALTWPGIDVGQQVWLTLTGQKADGSVHSLKFWIGGTHKVNATWISQGYWIKPLSNAFLAELGPGTTLTLLFKVSMDKSGEESTATVFPEQVYTIRAAGPALVIDTSTMQLDGLAVFSPYGWADSGVDFVGNTQVRRPSTGTEPYTFASENTAIAAVDSTGKVSGRANGSTRINVTDATGATASYPVTVSQVFELVHNGATVSVGAAVTWAASIGGAPLTAAIWNVMVRKYPNYPSYCPLFYSVSNIISWAKGWGWWSCQPQGSGQEIAGYAQSSHGGSQGPGLYAQVGASAATAMCVRPLNG